MDPWLVDSLYAAVGGGLDRAVVVLGTAGLVLAATQLCAMPRRWVSLLSASVLVMLLDKGHLAGEWVIGGAEAKGLAYVFVFCGLRSVTLARWGPMWLWFGIASAFHVLVGGWAVVAGGIAWLVSSEERPKLVTQLPWLAAGLVAALPGLVPAAVLSVGADAETAMLADQIYVLRRLPHHLVFSRFAPVRYASFGATLSAWMLVSWQLRDESSWRRLNRLTIGAVAVATIGVVLNVAMLLGWDAAIGWLRFYWFRLSDVLVPVSVSLGVPLLLQRWSVARRAWAPYAWTAVLVGCAGFTLLTFVEHQRDFRPRADAQSRPASLRARQRFQQWRLMCLWIAENTRPDDRFLTPRDQQTFKWYTGRSEVVSWKDIPQDAASIVRWWQLRESIYSPQVVIDGLGAWTDDQLLAIARQNRATHILVDRSRTKRSLSFPRLHANPSPFHASFELYRVPQ